MRAPETLAAALLVAACATGGTAPDECKIKVTGVETWNLRDGGLDAGYKVSGVAGSAGKTWLVAKTASGEYVSGYGVDVGPGPFQAVVDLKLTGVPKEFLAVLEVEGKRCRAGARKPS